MKKIRLQKLLIGLMSLLAFPSYSAQTTAITPASAINKTTTANFNDNNKPSNHQKQQANLSIATEEPKGCTSWFRLFRPICHRFHQIWTEGSNDLYISGYAWHNRFTYSAAVLREKKYNELAWGGGFGKGFFDEKGNWHGLYAFAFLDSHKNLEPIAGYAYMKVANLHRDFKAGLGLSVFITSRPDIMHNIPFPGIVPWAGFFYKRLSLKASYIPGSPTNGNVLYLVGTYTFPS